MIQTLFTLIVVVVLLAASQAWWRSLFNPVTYGILAWTPGLILMNWPPFFLSPLYIQLNRPITPLMYVALAIAFLSFWAGCAVVKAMSPRDAYVRKPAKLAWRASLPRTRALFLVGLTVFAYAYANSGLLNLQNLSDVGVAESRLALHLGWVSFLILLMDIAAITLFTRYLQQGQLINLLPILIAITCQAATLQKSRFIFLVMASVFVCCLYPRQAYGRFLSTAARRALVVGLIMTAFGVLLAMNEARGIAEVQMTAAGSPLYEQIYIYSNASAIQNVSVTIEGYIRSDPPAMGRFLLRPILWHVIDRDLLFATRYFEGINASTFLIYGWADFRWFGFVIMPFAVGLLSMLYLRAALGGSILGIMLGVIQFQAVIYSSGTDVLFDPTTLIVVLFSAAAWLIADFGSPGRQRRKPPRRPPDPRVPVGPHRRPPTGPYGMARP